MKSGKLGNLILNSAGYMEGGTQILFVSFFGFLLIYNGIVITNRRDWKRINAIVKNVNNTKCKSIKKCVKRGYRNRCYEYDYVNVKSIQIELWDGEKLIQRTLCPNSDIQYDVGQTLIVEYNKDTDETILPKPNKNVGILMIVLGLLCFLFATLIGYCTFDNSCRSGLGLFSILGALFDF